MQLDITSTADLAAPLEDAVTRARDALARAEIEADRLDQEARTAALKYTTAPTDDERIALEGSAKAAKAARDAIAARKAELAELLSRAQQAREEADRRRAEVEAAEAEQRLQRDLARLAELREQTAQFRPGDHVDHVVALFMDFSSMLGDALADYHRAAAAYRELDAEQYRLESRHGTPSARARTPTLDELVRLISQRLRARIGKPGHPGPSARLSLGSPGVDSPGGCASAQLTIDMTPHLRDS